MSVHSENLASLREEREPAPSHPSAPVGTGRSWRDRAATLLPWGLLLGFAALLLFVLGDRLIPAREVEVARIIAIRGSGGSDARAGSAMNTEGAGAASAENAPPLFQASGWVEPDPLPVKATALIDGVVREVHVLEGEAVRKGQLLATLVDDDAVLNLRTAESRLASLEALTEAQKEQPAIIRSEIATLAKGVAAAQARRAELEDQVKRFDALAKAGAGAVSEREVALARLQLATQEAEIAALGAREAELLGKLRLQEAMTRDFEARLAEAETEVDRRRLELERTRIVSPLDGVVLRLAAVPGQKRMLAMDDPDSSTIAVLYEPTHLQARIDVPLAEAAKLAPGQEVRLRSSLLPERVFHGVVTRIAGEADLQRNTLQAKVRIADPDPRLRPEMLCRAEFLAPRVAAEATGVGQSAAGATSATSATSAAASANTTASGGLDLFVPEAALTQVEGTRAVIWKIDASGDRIAPVTIALGAERRDDHRLALDGLLPGDRVVIDPADDLRPGERIRAEP